MGVDFGGIVRRSFEIAWRFKSLWVFGLFAGGGGGNFNFDLSDHIHMDPADVDHMFQNSGLGGLPFHVDQTLIAGLAALFVVMFLVWFVCNLIATPALIDGINKITRGGEYRFGDSFSRGVDFFLRFLGLFLLFFAVVLAVLGIVVVLAIILTPLSLILTIPAAIVFAFYGSHVFSLAEVAMVARDIGIADAIGEGHTLMIRNIGNCVIVTLVYIGLGLAALIIFGLLTLVLYLPINILVAIITQNLLVTILLAIIMGLPVSLVLGGYSGTFFKSIYVQFYFQLVEPGTVTTVGRPVPPAPAGPAV